MLARVLHVVVYALRYQDEVGEAEVDCQGDYCRDETGPEGARKVGDVADEPYCKKGERYAVCRARLVVFYELRDLRGY
jgi:hypothetical protein